MKQKIIILDYGSGNVKSVANSLDYLNINFSISNNDTDLDNSTHIILLEWGHMEYLWKIKK